MWLLLIFFFFYIICPNLFEVCVFIFLFVWIINFYFVVFFFFLNTLLWECVAAHTRSLCVGSHFIRFYITDILLAMMCTTQNDGKQRLTSRALDTQQVSGDRCSTHTYLFTRLLAHFLSHIFCFASTYTRLPYLTLYREKRTYFTHYSFPYRFNIVFGCVYVYVYFFFTVETIVKSFVFYFLTFSFIL